MLEIQNCWPGLPQLTWLFGFLFYCCFVVNAGDQASVAHILNTLPRSSTLPCWLLETIIRAGEGAEVKIEHHSCRGPESGPAPVSGRFTAICNSRPWGYSASGFPGHPSPHANIPSPTQLKITKISFIIKSGRFLFYKWSCLFIYLLIWWCMMGFRSVETWDFYKPRNKATCDSWKSPSRGGGEVDPDQVVCPPSA